MVWAMAARLARFARTTALLAVTAAVVAGCGSYTKKDYVSQADGICIAALHRFRTLPARGGVASYLRSALPILSGEIRQLRSLRRPAQSARSRAAQERWLAALSRSGDLFATLARVAAAGDLRGVSSTERMLAGEPVAALAAAYGVGACGTPGPTIESVDP
jgi:hypothetical protein